MILFLSASTFQVNQSSSLSSSSRSQRLSYTFHEPHPHHSDKKKRGHISLKTHKLLSTGHKSTTPLVKKKRRKRRRLGDDEDDDSGDDPDFVG